MTEMTMVLTFQFFFLVYVLYVQLRWDKRQNGWGKEKKKEGKKHKNKQLLIHKAKK